MSESTRHAKALWLEKPQTLGFREQVLPALPEGYARVRALFGAVSRGTESLVVQGKIPESEYQRMRAPFQEGDFPAPVKYGYINVGEVEAGPSEWRGRQVFCLHPHQNFYQVPVEALRVLPKGLAPERAVLGAGMETAVNVVWDARATVGDRIAVVGGGVIGILCAYLCAQIPGTRVQLIDSNDARRAVCEHLGVSFARPADAAHADLVIHASGNPLGLRLALELADVESRVVEMSWYGETDVSVPLGQGFHAKRLQIVSSQVGRIPADHAARWDYGRRFACALELLRDDRLDVLISGESTFDDLPAALAEICAQPGALCHRIRYPRA